MAKVSSLKVDLGLHARSLPGAPAAEPRSGYAAHAGDEDLGAASIKFAAQLQAHPDDSDARCEAFWLCMRQGLSDDARVHALELVASAPDAPLGYLFLGNLAVIAEDFETALHAYERGIKACPDTVELLRGMGECALRLERFDEALAAFHRVVSVESREPLSHHDLGRVREAQRRFADAVRHYDRAIALDSDFIPSALALGVIYRTMRQWDAALDVFERAVVASPDNPQAIALLASSVLQHGDVERARLLFIKTNELAPGFPEVVSLLGGAELNACDFDNAGRHLREAVELEPERANNQFNLSLYLLMTGDLAAGWDAYEYGLDTEQRELPWYFSRWAGQPLAGRTVYVSAEQGLGDEVMFAACLPDLLGELNNGPPSADGRCIVGCDPRLRGLFARSFPGVQVLSDLKATGGAPGTTLGQVDYQIAIGSLAWRYRRTESNFSARRSYLVAQEGLRNECRERLGRLKPGLRVGVSWRGGGVPLTRLHRTIMLSDWAPLFALDGVEFINLQYGDTAADREGAERDAQVTIHDLGVDLTHDIESLCALISELDLVISIDNSAVHLAGALGTPVWVIVPAKPDWRWMLGRDDSPWYPSVRLVRRQKGDAADVVMNRLADDLGQLAQ
jgi:tetratricopeptide (TPR) repeat protein